MITASTPSPEAWDAIRGGFDLHVHVAPDVIARRIDDLDLAREFVSHGLKGFALKSHYFPTGERAAVVTKAVPGVTVFGTISLNHSVGGLNPVAVELAGRSGCKIVWMPTVDAANEVGHLASAPPAKLPFWAEIQNDLNATGINRPPISVIDSDGRVVDTARICLELIAKHGMVLATGHLGRHEIFALVALAKALHVGKVVVTHPEFPSQHLSVDEQFALAGQGATIEHCFTTPHTGKAPWAAVFDGIRRVGAARCLMSTDLGQKINPPIAEGFALFAQTLLDAGFSTADVQRMAVTNAAALVN